MVLHNPFSVKDKTLARDALANVAGASHRDIRRLRRHLRSLVQSLILNGPRAGHKDRLLIHRGDWI